MALTQSLPQPFRINLQSVTANTYSIPNYLGNYDAQVTANATWTLPAQSGLPTSNIINGAFLYIRNNTSYAIQLIPQTGETINNTSSVTLAPASSIIINSQGAGTTNWTVFSQTSTNGGSMGAVTGIIPNGGSTQTGNVAFNAGPGVSITNPSTSVIDISNTGVRSINATGQTPQTGAIIIAAGEGIELVQTSGQIEILNSGALGVSLNSSAVITGVLNITTGINIVATYTPPNTITFNVPTGAGGVAAIREGTGSWETGLITLSPGSGITIVDSPSGTFTITNAGITGLTINGGSTQTGTLNLAGLSTTGVAISQVGTTVSFTNTGVLGISANSGSIQVGQLNFISGSGVSVTASAGNFTFATTSTGVTSIKVASGTAETGAITLTPGNNLSITDSPAGTFTLAVTGYHADPSTTYNVLAGFNTGTGNTGTTLLAMGPSAGASNTGNYVIAIGSTAGQNNTGAGVIALGRGAALNNTPSSTIAIGDSTLNNGNTGSGVTIIGTSSAQAKIAGNYTTGLGYSILNTLNGGNYITALGATTDVDTAARNSAILIGYGAKSSATLGDGQLALASSTAPINLYTSASGLQGGTAFTFPANPVGYLPVYINGTTIIYIPYLTHT